jgi:iron complex transport system ATP-binding protein
MIAFHGIRVRYPRREQPALDGVSVDANRGVITAVVGPNGSGKSTLVRALLGRVPLADGRIEIDGIGTSASSREDIARKVAVVTQREESVFPITVREYVALGRLPHRGAWGRDTLGDRAAVNTALGLTELDTFAERTVDQLSGGEWQRARCARALAQGGDAFVADEPTTFLDIGHAMAVFELLGRVAREGRAVLLVSHDLNLVARFADRLVLLSAGKVAASGAVDDVMRADVLESVYGWPLVVNRDPAVGAPALVPLRRPVGASHQTKNKQ